MHRFAICTSNTYWTGKDWSKNHKDAKVYKTMRVRDVCNKLQVTEKEPMVCINLDNGKLFY